MKEIMSFTRTMLIRQSAQSVGLEVVDSKSNKVTLKQAF